MNESKRGEIVDERCTTSSEFTILFYVEIMTCLTSYTHSILEFYFQL